MRASIAIMAGGNATRFGADKTLATLHGVPFIRRIVAELSPLTDDVMIIAKRTEKFGDQYRDVRLVRDEFPEQCPMVGIITALAAAKHEVVFAVSADAPLVRAGMARMVIDRLENHDVAVPLKGEKMYPLLAAYHRRTLGFFRTLHGRGHYKIIRAYEELSTVMIGEADAAVVDPGLSSFININTPEDLKQAELLPDPGPGAT